MAGRLIKQGAILWLLLAVAGWSNPACAQMGATPENANKLSFEALTASPPPPRPAYRPAYTRHAVGHYTRWSSRSRVSASRWHKPSVSHSRRSTHYTRTVRKRHH